MIRMLLAILIALVSAQFQPKHEYPICVDLAHAPVSIFK